MSTTPNMNLVVPEVLVTSGPQYATQINASLDVVDAHDHSSGKGVRVTPSGLNINVDLPFNSNQATGLKGVVLTDQDAVTYLTNAAVFRSGADLYYRDGNGVAIRITASGAINTASVGAITALASPAAATYVAASKKFVWLSTGTEYATMEAGDLKVISTASGATQAVTIKADVATSAYDLRLPDLGPTDNQIMRMKASSAGTFVSLLGTTNQVTVTHNSGDITLALPQNIHTAATPTFAGLTLTGAMTGTSLALAGALSGVTTGAFSGQVNVGSLVSAGAVSGTDATFTGDLNLTGFLKSISGTFINATLRTVSTSNDISSSTKVTAPTLQAGSNTLTSIGGLTVNQVITPSLLPSVAGSSTEIQGRTNLTAYPAFAIGEIVTANMASSVTTSTGYQNLITLNLTAGVWEVSANVVFTWNVNSVTARIKKIETALSLTSGLADSMSYTTVTYPNADGGAYYSQDPGDQITLLILSRRIQVNASTPVYLVGRSQVFGTGTNNCKFDSAGTIIKAQRVG
jgi:hypothetical protein